MQQDKSKSHQRRRSHPATKAFRVTVGNHTFPMTDGQVLGDKSGWIACHGKVGDGEVRSLSYKQIGDKIMVKDGQGRLAGCYDANEFAVMAKTFLSTTNIDSITIDAKA